MASPLDPFNASQTIRAEAETLLREYGLAETLAKYGTVVPTGSFHLDLMAWRDLDLYLGVEEFDKGDLYRLVHDMAVLLQPFWLEARSMIDNPEPDFPTGYFIGMETRIVGSSVWNIDLFAMSMEEIVRAQTEVDARKRALDPARRNAILEIKNHAGYRDWFHSMDVYDAVILGSVRSEEDFECWLRTKASGQ